MSEESEKDRFQEMEYFFYPGQVRILRERMPDGSLRRIESDEIVHVLNSLNKCLRDSQEAWRELARKNQELRKRVIDLETVQEDQEDVVKETRKTFKDLSELWLEKFPAAKEAIKPKKEEEPKKFTCMDCVHCYVSDMPMRLGEPMCRKHRTGWDACKGNDFKRKEE